MRKITVLFSLVCAFLFGLTATAQSNAVIASVTRVSAIEEGKWYIMELDNNPSYLYEESNHNLKRKSGANETAVSLVGTEVNDDVKKSLVRFSKNDDDTYSIRLATGYYFPQLTGNGQITASSDNVGHFYMHTFTSNSNTYFQFGSKSPDVTTSANKSFLIDGGANRGSNVTSWNNVYKNAMESNAGDIWALYELEFSVGSVKVASSYEALDAKGYWYAMYTGNARMYVYDENVTDGYPAIDNATFMKLDDNHFWGFVCNDLFTAPVKIKIMNKGAGDGKYLQMQATRRTNRNEFGDRPCKMVSSAEAERVNWTFHQSGNTDKYTDGYENYYGIKCADYTVTSGSTTHDQYINNFNGDGFMTSWWQDATADAGTGIKFVSELDTYRTLAERALTAPEGAVHSLKAECRQQIGEASAISGKTLPELVDIVKSHNEAGHSAVQMEDNGYYRILNWYDHDNTPKVIGIGGNSRALVAQDNNDVDQIWKAGHVGGNNDLQYSFQNANTSKYLNVPQTAGLGDNAVTYTLTDLGAGQHFFISGQVLVGNINSGNLNGIGNVTTNSPHRKNTKDAWYLMPATELEVTLRDGGDNKFYATAHFPFATSIEGADAYIMDGYDAEGGKISLKKVEGEIPANTGLVLVGTTGATAKVKIWTKTPEPIDNRLKGTNEVMTITDKADYLVLGKGQSSQKVGFYQTKSTQIRRNSAYLRVSDLGASAANGLNFEFGGTVDGIQGVENADDGRTSVIYDLQGRRVNAPGKGIYIINGKKVIR